MKLLRSIRSALWGPSPENPANSVYQPWWLWGAAPTESGSPVNEHSALRLTAVYAAVRVIAETIGSLPLFVYRRQDDGGRTVLRDHPVSRLLHDEPNPLMDASTFREALLASTLLWGNGFAAIMRDQAGRIAELWPMRADFVEVRKRGDRVTYVYSPPDAGEPIELDPKDVIHVPGLAFDGVCGLSPIALAREAVGLGLSAEIFGARFFGAGTHPSGVVEVPEHLTDTTRATMSDNIGRAHQGLFKSHRTMILEGGAKWTAMGIPPEDAQFLETRQFQVQEIARLYRVPPSYLQEHSRSTFSNVEHMSIQFVTMTLRPWLVRLEQEYRRKLLPQTTTFCEHVVEGLLRGDLKSRYNAYAIARQWGWMSVNDVRQLENMNPIGPEGDVYLQPMNMDDAEIASDKAEAELEHLEAQADNAGRFGEAMFAMNGAADEGEDEDEAEEQDD